MKIAFNTFLFSLTLILFTACENDLSKVKEIELKQKGDVEITKGAQIIYSDSAYVKAKLNTPLLYHYKTAAPYYEMPKGIEVLLFDKNLKQTTKVTSKYAIQRENEKVVQLKKNVVATNAEGSTFESEELIWDENTKKFYSNLPVTITLNKGLPTQKIIHGPGFWANEDFSYYEIRQGSGVFNFKGDAISQ
jgi:LPS export ABC transporter protein LptC